MMEYGARRSETLKTPYLKVTRPASHGEHYGCWMPLKAFSAADEFDGAEPGEKVVLELCEFTQAEIDAMPEFAGW
jgi:hypothetical protein